MLILHVAILNVLFFSFNIQNVKFFFIRENVLEILYYLYI